jgi:hypothetical protein
MGRPKNLRLPNVTCNKAEFDLTLDYGKKPALLDLKSSPQDLVAFSRRRKAKFYNLEG